MSPINTISSAVDYKLAATLRDPVLGGFGAYNALVTYTVGSVCKYFLRGGCLKVFFTVILVRSGRDEWSMKIYGDGLLKSSQCKHET